MIIRPEARLPSVCVPGPEVERGDGHGDGRGEDQPCPGGVVVFGWHGQGCGPAAGLAAACGALGTALTPNAVATPTMASAHGAWVPVRVMISATAPRRAMR